MRIASIAALNLGRRVRKWGSKKCKNAHYGSLPVLSVVEILSCPGPGWFPLGVIPRAKPVPPLLKVGITISPPMLRHHERSRLSVVGFNVGGAIPSGTCGHFTYSEVGRSSSWKLEPIGYRGSGEMRVTVDSGSYTFIFEES